MTNVAMTTLENRGNERGGARLACRAFALDQRRVPHILLGCSPQTSQGGPAMASVQRKRAKPGSSGGGRFFHIELRPAEAFNVFRVQDVGERGGVRTRRRSAPHRPLGHRQMAGREDPRPYRGRPPRARLRRRRRRCSRASARRRSMSRAIASAPSHGAISPKAGSRRPPCGVRRLPISGRRRRRGVRCRRTVPPQDAGELRQ